jgi:hypothetical protein
VLLDAATPARPDAGPVRARAARPWQQDFPLPIGRVLAVTAGTGIAARSRAEPAIPSPGLLAAREPTACHDPPTSFALPARTVEQRFDSRV